MIHTRNIIMLITFALLLLLSACSFKPLVSQQTIEVQAKQEVVIKAKEGATSYKWAQLSGVSVVLVDTDKQTLKFTAPEVEKEEVLLFELEAKFGYTIEKVQVTVIVFPVVGSGGGDDAATGGSDGNTTGGTDNNSSLGGDDNTTTTPTVALTSLKLTVDKTSLKKDENITVKVMAVYSDSTTKEVTSQITWEATPSDAIRLTNATLTALQDKSTTVKAKLKGVVSDAVSLNIIWVVNGHTLPPEPDPTINNSTLLGIDSNDNGVRDDVERWIYEEYKDKHPIHVDIGMQAGRGYKKVLETPERAKEIRAIVNASNVCNWYYKGYAELFGEALLVQERIDTKVFSKYFNTKKRNDTYRKYDKLLSGGVYDTPDIENMKSFCDFNTGKYGE